MPVILLAIQKEGGFLDLNKEAHLFSAFPDLFCVLNNAHFPFLVKQFRFGSGCSW